MKLGVSANLQAPKKLNSLSFPLPWQGQERKSVKRSGILAKGGSIKQTRVTVVII